MYGAAERMADWKSSIWITIVALKHVNTFFGNKYTAAERINLTMDDCKILRYINTVFFKEWMTSTLSVRETDNLIQRLDERH